MAFAACHYGRRIVVEERSHAPDERRRADRRVPDPPKNALRVRFMRSWQRRAARCALRRARPNQIRLAAPRAGRRPYGGRLLPRAPRTGRDAHFVRAGLVQHRDAARGGAERFLRPDGDHRQRADIAVQPQPVPGDQPPSPGGLPEHHPAGGQAQFSADPRRHAAARVAPSSEPHGVGPAGAGERRRAIQRVPGGGRARVAAPCPAVARAPGRRGAGGSHRRGRDDPRGRPARPLRRPRRDVVGSRARADRTGAPHRHSRDRLAQRHGLSRHGPTSCRSASSGATAPIRRTKRGAAPTS